MASLGVRRAALTAEEEEMLQGTWPLELIKDDARAPLEAASAEDFVMHALLGDHLEDVVVLRGGGKLLGLDEEVGLPAWFREGLEPEGGRAPTVLDFLRRVVKSAPEEAKQHKATIEFVDKGVQREAKPKRPRRRASRSRSPSKESASRRPSSKQEGRVSRSRSRSSSRSRSPSMSREERETLKNLCSRLTAAEAYVDRGDARECDLYVCEMRRLRQVPRGEQSSNRAPPSALLGQYKTKTLLGRQTADAFGDLGRWTLSWDTRDDGVFVGGRGSGKGLHVDQVFWSNVGHNWRGHKLVATWPAGSASSKLHATMLDCVFAPPLKPEQLEALQYAKRIVLLRPGDVFIMSGGVAHTTLTVSSDALNVTSYESIVTLAPTHARHFLRTSSKGGPYALPRGAMPKDELEDFKDAIVDALENIVQRPNTDFNTLLFKLSTPVQIALETVLREQLERCVDVLVQDSFFDKELTPTLRRAVKSLARAPLGDRRR